MRMLTVKEVARELNVSPPTVYRLINEHKLPAIVVSGVKIRKLRVQQKDLDAYIETHRTIKNSPDV